MSDNRKYYYMKLKENFFETEEMIILESMQDGYLYSNILMKLYLRSLKNNGCLMFKGRIPYSPAVLAQVVRHSAGVVEKALEVFVNLQLIEIMDNGAIYMSDIQNFIGKSSTEADRKRTYRAQIEEARLIENGQMSGQTSGQMSDKNPPELDIELDIELEKEIEIEKKTAATAARANKFAPIVAAWNSLNLTQIRSIQGNRAKMLQARVSEYGPDAVLEAISKIQNSHFLRGQNDKGWVISFDWFIKPANFLKVLEGNYEDRMAPTAAGQSKYTDDDVAHLLK